MLATSCQQGHLDVVRLLVWDYDADVKDFAVHSDEFAVITGQPLYAAAQAGNEEIAHFLLENGAGFSSYTLMDFPDFSKRLLRQKLQETGSESTDEVSFLNTAVGRTDFSDRKNLLNQVFSRCSPGVRC
ncbi:leucine-rich repeat serine/threonine-protein kinase 1-like [Kryptolebias marmoratus]|uniref:leucine-rich repeat serine/threonine-protein kinase 1-like n=1 Tax=Kryptolebias marmoratus TaxID=37003 RepID=UPI0018ACB63A|nr:leucine-rich repeat serine/threonine-protein kinase 1-like [Kryptolebias marmoratus]